MNVVSDLNEALIESLLRTRTSFEVIGLRGNFMASIKWTCPYKTGHQLPVKLMSATYA